MTLSVSERVRLLIQDPPRVFDETRAFDGTAALIALSWPNLTSATAYITASGGAAWTATGASFNASGWVEFSSVPAAGVPFRVRGVYSVFSEAEIGQFTADGGTVKGAALEACQVLMFDSLKRAQWAAPDGSSYDDTAAMAQLKVIYDLLAAQLAAAETESGGWVSWSEGQADL